MEKHHDNDHYNHHKDVEHPHKITQRDLQLEIYKLLVHNYYQTQKIIMTQAELKDKLDSMTTQMGKINAEVKKLLDAVTASGDVSPEVQTAMDNLQTAIQGVDDENQDS